MAEPSIAASGHGASLRPAYTALVLAGGRSRRMGEGVDKLALPWGDGSVLEAAVDACADASAIVIVGDERPLRREAVFVREEPPFSGPLAGVARGLAEVRTPMVVVLAGDMPTAASVPDRLAAILSAHPSAEAVMPRDADGWPQVLCAAYDVAALRRALAEVGDPTDVAMRRVLDLLEVAFIDDVDDRALRDVDTPADWATLTASTDEED